MKRATFTADVAKKTARGGLAGKEGGSAGRTGKILSPIGGLKHFEARWIPPQPELRNREYARSLGPL